MASSTEAPGLHSREGRISLTDLLEAEGIGPSQFKVLISSMTPKQKSLLMVFVHLTEFYVNAFKDATDAYEGALRANHEFREWVDARLPGEKDILRGESAPTNDGSER